MNDGMGSTACLAFWFGGGDVLIIMPKVLAIVCM